MNNEVKHQVKIQNQQQNKKKRTRKKVLPWTKEQSTLYLRFIAGNRAIFKKKKMDSLIFQTMAKFIGSNDKGSKECYNYHIRMKIKYGAIEDIIKGLQEEHGVAEEEIKVEESMMRDFKVNLFKDFQKQIKTLFLTLRRPKKPPQKFSSETKVRKTELNLK